MLLVPFGGEGRDPVGGELARHVLDRKLVFGKGAAGSDENGCALRAVTYAAPVAADALVKHYADVAAKAGYSVAVKDEGKGKIVSGKRAADGGSFYVIVEGQGAASTADLVVNNGR
jgi:hypothetical protein